MLKKVYTIDEIAEIAFSDGAMEMIEDMRRDGTDPADVYLIGFYDCILCLADPVKKEVIEKHIDGIREATAAAAKEREGAENG